MSRFRPTRRSFLRGVFGGTAVTLALPVLPCWLNNNGTAFASGEGLPRRFVMFFWGNGNLPDRWVPDQVGPDYALTPQLMPLARHKERFSVVTGTRVRIPNIVPHFSGAAGLLSGQPLDTSGGQETFASASIDQRIAAEIGRDTRFRSIELGADARAGLSYSAAGSRNPPEDNPHALFLRLFGEGFRLPGEDPIIDPRWALRRSVLDAIGEDAADLRKRIGAEDKVRLDQHLDGIRDLERRLARLEDDPPDLASCDRPGEPAASYPPIDGRLQMAEKNRVFTDLMAMALACDQTRVISNFFSYPVSNVLFPGASAGHHQLTHDEPGDQPEVHMITMQCLDAFAELLDALIAVPEGEGTLFDRCAVLGTTEISYGRTHSLEEFPILVAGGAGGRLRLGEHIRSTTGDSTSRVMLSLARSVDAGLASFGEGDQRASEGFGALEL